MKIRSYVLEMLKVVPLKPQTNGSYDFIYLAI